ncbi:hypothetical protein X738_20440 [Mesorhizobium sp. LNHC209A00]|nr:hypothetical protein X741_20500 [Mesorhizobium sp. LNHC229A00]ESY96993.1 hypothetical protein X738_20440 [Mesorhizobium sp. LNHC209A00]
MARIKRLGPLSGNGGGQGIVAPRGWAPKEKHRMQASQKGVHIKSLSHKFQQMEARAKLDAILENLPCE